MASAREQMRVSEKSVGGGGGKKNALRLSAIFSSFHASETKLIYCLSCSAWHTQT